MDEGEREEGAEGKETYAGEADREAGEKRREREVRWSRTMKLK